MRPRRNAFTLVEILVVISVIGAMAALVIPSLVGILRGSQLSTGIEIVFGVFSNARQLGATTNHDIEVRLIEMKDPASPSSTSQIRALQMLEIREDGLPNQIGKTGMLPSGVIIGSPAEMTSLSALANITASAADPSIPRVGRDYKYRSFRFRPDGSLDLHKKAKLSGVSNYFITLYDEKFSPRGGIPPANFATIQFESATGATALYRP